VGRLEARQMLERAIETGRRDQRQRPRSIVALWLNLSLSELHRMWTVIERKTGCNDGTVLELPGKSFR
jgi:hypothetical protein